VQKRSWHGAPSSQRGAPIRLSIFDDRLEIDNPGLLPFGLTVEDLPQDVSRLRNRMIGRVIQALGLIEQWGSGIQRMTAVCRDASLKEGQGLASREIAAIIGLVR